MRTYESPDYHDILCCLMASIATLAFILYLMIRLCTFIYNRMTKSKLQRKLEWYYDNHVKISPGDMKAARKVLAVIKSDALKYLKENMDHLDIDDLVDTGSTVDGLKVVRPDEFDVLIKINLKGWQWHLSDAMDSPGFRLVTNSGRNECTGMYLKSWSPLQHSNESRILGNYVKDQYLSPADLRRDFQSVLHRFADNYTKYSICISTHGPAITLTVKYGWWKAMSVDMVPLICIDGQDLVAKPHPDAYFDKDKFLLWRKSFSSSENAKFQSMPDDHKKCLKILKGIRLNCPQLKQISSYVLKTAYLHFFNQLSMSGRVMSLETLFQEYIQFLVDRLRSGRLSPFFEIDYRCNILEKTSSGLLNLANFLQKKLNRNEFDELLETH